MESERRIEEERDIEKREIKGEGDSSDRKSCRQRGCERWKEEEERERQNGNDGWKWKKKKRGTVWAVTRLLSLLLFGSEML